MDFKESMKNAAHKFMSFWKTGKVQRSTRITYGVFWNIFLFFLVVGFIGVIFLGGLGAGYFASLVKDEEIRDYETMAQDVYDYAETSRMFFADNVYFGEVSADIHRDETTLDQISPMLIDAVIATEDEYFNEHEGIVPKALMRAVIQEVTGSANQTGGSTLTQQLIKNQMLTNEVSFERKATEILLALRLERFFDKDEILEAYLNIVPYGRNASGSNIAGIQTATQGIFGIDASEVNLAQAAYLAGLPQSPSAYTPFANGGGLKSEEGIQRGLNRMVTVLNRMLEMEYINQEQYEEALAYDLVADFKEEEQTPHEQYPILTAEIQERAEEILYKQFIEEDGYTEQDMRDEPELQKEYKNQAFRALRMNGYEIHSTIDKDLYDTFRKVAAEFDQYGGNTVTQIPIEDGYVTKEQYVQAAGVLIENSTGKIVSFLGSRKYSLEDQLNYTTRLRQNGSTMKPFVYGAAMEEGEFQPGTPIPDVYLEVPNAGGTREVRNIDRRHHGMMSARTQLAKSYNVPATRAYLYIMDINPVERYFHRMGMTSINDFEYANASLAIGGLHEGISLEDNTNAFASIANGGQYMDAYIIEKITTKDGEVIYEHEAEPKQVFSPQTSYLLIDMMRDVLSDGTATQLRSMLTHQNVDWAGKTGTTSANYDVQFLASNPNVTFATWMGYEVPDSLESYTASLPHSIRNQRLWAALINAASEIRPELVAPSHAFQQPDGIVSRSYCSISGKLPSDLCEQAGLVKTDLFNEKFVPTERDNSLMTGEHVRIGDRSVSAGSSTPNEFISGDGLMFTPDFLREFGLDKLDDMSQILPHNEDRSKWENIGFPGSMIDGEVEDNGESPPPPTSVSASSDQLTWNKPSSNSIVGYRIYRADSENDRFSKIGNTTSTSFNVNGEGVYLIKAVDYFGRESEESKIIRIGDPPDEDEDEDEEPKSEDKDEDEDNEDSSEDNEDNEEDE